MDDVDTFQIQQTPPPSPYHETTWDLKLDQVQEALLHPKEKKLGYLELYFQGFMEFADDASPSPEMSDDEEEYPRWGSFSTSRDKNSMSSATSVVSQEDLSASISSLTSITGDHDPPMCHTPQRMTSPEHDSKDLHGLESTIASHHKPLHSHRYHKRPVKPCHKHKLAGRRHAVVGRSRVGKECPARNHTMRSRSKIRNGHQT